MTRNELDEIMKRNCYEVIKSGERFVDYRDKYHIEREANFIFHEDGTLLAICDLTGTTLTWELPTLTYVTKYRITDIFNDFRESYINFNKYKK